MERKEKIMIGNESKLWSGDNILKLYCKKCYKIFEAIEKINIKTIACPSCHNNECRKLVNHV
jgi:hypothetical protein